MEQINFFKKRFLLLFILIFLSGTFIFAQNAGADQDVACNNTTLDAQDPAGVWTTSGGATIADPTNPKTTVTGLVAGVNTFTWTVGGFSDDVFITYHLANAGADLPNECSSATLAATNPAPLSGFWTAPSGVIFDDSTNPTAVVSNLPSGSTNLTWTITSGAGCSNSDVMAVTNNTPIADAGTADETCNNNSYQLNGNDPSAQGATGQWSIVSGAGTFADATLYNTVVSGMNQDNNEYRWTLTKNGCTASNTVIITNNTVFASASNQEVCATTATLDGNDPATFGTATGTWTTVGGTSASITTPNQYNTGVTGLDADANQFNWQITKGSCSDDITITITNNSVTANAGLDQPTLCANNTALAANTVAGATGQWSVQLGSGTFADNTLATTAVSGLSSDWNRFRWTLTKGSCSDNDDVDIRNILPNTADAGPNQSVCGTTASLSGNAVTTPNSAGIWTVISGGAITFVDDTDPTTDIDGLANGDNILNWRIYSSLDNTCFTEDQVTITNISLTGVTAGPDQNVCGSTATLAGSDPGAGSGVWTLISGSGSPTFPSLSNTPVTGLGQGPNTFEWTVTGGACSGSDQVVIYNDFPSTANAGADGESCDGTYVLAANNPVIGTGAWSSTALGPVFANNTVFNTTVSNLNNGINTLTWTITNGACSDADDVVITNNTVTPPYAGPDQQACTDTYTLAAQDPIEGSGQWSVITGTAAFADATLFNTSVVVQRGDNQLRWTVTKGTCSASDDVVISNYSVTANAGLDNYTCDGTFTLQGNNPASQYIAIPGINATGTWTTTGPATIANPNIFNTGISGLNPDANTFTWTIDNGFCSASDDVVISNDMPTLPSISTNDTTFCGVDFLNADNGESYSSIFNALHANTPDYLRGGVGENGVWTQIAGSGTFLDASTNPDMRVDNLAQYAQLTGPDFWSLNPTVNTFRWTITYKNCSLYDEVTITNAAPNLADAGPDQRVCFDEANLNALDHGSRAQTHVWTESAPGGSGAVIDDPNAFNSYVYSLQSDTTTFRWTKTNVINGITCLVWDETQIIKTNNTGRPNAGPNQILCSTEADMAASPADIGFPATDVVAGQWSTLIGTGNFADITDPSTHVTNLAYQTNIFRWTVTNTTQNCIATDDVEITNALPSNANAGPDQYVCTNTALLSADRPTRGTGEWSVIGGGGTISNTTCQNFSCNVYVSNMGTGKNTFLWTMSNSYTDPASGDTKTCTLTDEIQVWNNQVTAEAGLDQTVCVDNATLSATAPGIGENGQWTVTGGSGIVADISLYNSTVANLSPNVNTFRWRLSNAYCSDEDYMTIINNNPTDPSVSVPSTDICVDNTQINANNPINGTGLWSVTTGGGTIANPSLASTTATGLIVGLNEFTWTITKNGCPESATVQVYNKSVTADAGTDIDNICGIEPAISSVNLAATSPNYTNGESGTWTVVTGVGTVNIADPTAFNTLVTGMDDGVNTFRWTITNGTCSANDLVDVRVYIPTTSSTNPDREVCASLTDIETLTANSPDPGRGFGTWTLVSGGGAIADPTSNVTNVTNLGYNENRFRWTIDHNGCTSTDDIILTNNYVIANAGPDQSICTDVATLAANDPTVNDVSGLAQASGQWTVVQGSGVFVNDTQYDSQVSGLSTAVTNILRWTVTKGSGICSVSDDVSIINNEFTVTAGVDQTVCNDNTILNGQQPGANQTGLWSLQSGGGSFVAPTLYNTQVTGLSINPNIFKWTVTNTTADNCSANDLVTVYYNKVEANAGVDDQICTDFTNLNATLPNTGASGNWVATVGGASITTPSSNTTAVTNLGTGQNTFEWTVSRTMNGQYCEAKDYVNIYNDTPTSALVENDKSVCDDFSTLNVLTSPVIGTGVWSRLDNAATIDNISSLNANVTGLNLGINTFRWTVTKNACSSTDDLVITNNKVIADAGLDKSTACMDITTLSANDPNLTQGTGLWTDLNASGATIQNPTLYNTQVINLASGTTQFQWTVSLSGCSKSDIVEITNNQITATINSGNQTTCNDWFGPLDGNNVAPLGGTGVWSSGDATITFDNITVYNTTVRNLPIGSNVLTWTVTSAQEGCTDNADVTITNNSVSPNAGIDFETCDATITLNASAPIQGTGVWSQQNGPSTVSFANSLQANTQVSGLIGGVYVFRWTVTQGSCSDYDEVTVTNNTPSQSVPSTPTAEICNNANGQLNANPLLTGETGLWSSVIGGGTISDNTNPNTIVSNLQLGTNTFRWTISKGNTVVCKTQADVTITNNTVVANANTDQDVCSTTAQLAGNNPNSTQGTGIWTKFGANPAIIANNTLYNTTVSNLSDNSTHGFTWTVSLGSCSQSDDVYITNNMVLANAGADGTTCNDYYTLDGNDVSSTGASGIWSKQTGSPASFVDETVYNTQVNSLAAGINVFTWTVTSAKGCVDQDDVTITYNKVVANAGLDKELCESSTNLSAIVTPPGTGYWQQVGGSPTLSISLSTDPNATISGMTGGNYTFRWTFTNNSCTDTDDVLIINSSPQQATANALAESCDGTGWLTGNVPNAQETGLWVKVDAGGSIDIPSSENANVSGMKQGNNIYKWTLTKGTNVTCVSEAQVTIVNNEILNVVANSGTGQLTTCDGTITLSGTNPADESADRGEWTVNTGAVIALSSAYQTSASNLVLGNNIFTWTLYKGNCQKTANVTISNNSATAQITSPTGTDTEVCDGTVTLTANSSTGSGVWKLVSGNGIIQNSLNTTTTVTGLEKNNNIFRWTVDNGICIATDEITIVNNQVFPQANNISICDDFTTMPGIDPSIIDNSIDANYWINSGGTAAIIQNSTQYNSAVTNLAPNVNSFRWYLEKGKCVDYKEIQIVNQGVVASANDVSSCTMPVALDGSPPPSGANGQWSHVAGTYTFVDDNTLYNARITDIPLGSSASLVWTVTKGVCSDATNPITVTNNNFALSAGNDDGTCTGEIQLNGQDISGGTGFWQVMSGAGIFDNSAGRNTWVRQLANNDNVLRWTVDNGNCTNYADVTISNNQVFAQISAATMVVCESKATLNAINPAPFSGLWESLDASSNPPTILVPSAYNSTVTGLKPGSNMFKWTVTGNSGCSDEAFLNIVNDTVILASLVETTEICGYSTNLWANDPNPNTGVWNSVGLNPIVQNSTQYNSAVTNLDQGTNTFYWTVTSNTGGCSSTQRFDIVNNMPDPADAGPDVPNLCSDQVQLNANSPIIGTGIWSLVSGNGNIVDKSVRDTWVYNLQSGTNEFQWTITNKNCTTVDNVIINSNAIAANAGLDQLNLCATTTTLNAILNNPADESGVWTVIGGNALVSNSLSESTVVSGLDKGNNTFRWTVTNTAGCSDTDDVLIVNNIPVKPVTDPDINACLFTQSVNATAPPSGGTGLWTRIAGSGTFDNPTNYNPVVISGLSNVNVNRFEWKVTVNGCSNSDTITIINNGVTASVDPDAETCDNFYTLRAVAPNVGTGVWSKLSGNGIIANSLNNTTLVNNLDQGDNSFRWTVTRGGCSDYADLTITNNAPDAADAGSLIQTCDANITLLGNDPVIGTGLWTKTAGSSSTIMEPTVYNTAVIIPVKGNPYSEIFTWTLSNKNCVSSSTVTVYQNGFLNFANADDYTCDGSYNLAGRDPASISPTATGLWSITSGNGTFDNSMAYNAIVSNLAMGANTLEWTITDNSCSASEEVIITNDQVSISAGEGATASICNDFRPIVANNPSIIGASGKWTVVNPNGQTIDNDTEFSTVVRNLTEGNNLVKWTVTKNLCLRDTTITIEYFVPNAYITMGDVLHACSDTTILTADPPSATGSGIWTLKYGSAQVTIDDNTAYSTIARNLEITDNVFVWTVTDRGCTANDEVSINNSMPINSNGSDQSGCTAEFVMNAQVPTSTGSGIWSVVSSPGTPIIEDNTLASTKVTVPYGNTILQWAITDNGCTATKQFNVTNNQPVAVAGDGQTKELCVNYVQLSGNVPNVSKGETGVWTIDGGPTTEIFDDSTSPTATVTNLRQGQVTFVWTISNASCSDEDRAVYINNTPVVYAGSNRTICEDETNLAGNVPEPGAVGKWTISSSTVVIENNTQYNTHVSSLGNNNLFTWTVDNGKCSASDDVLITSRAFKVSAGLAYQEACSDTLILDATDPATVGTGTGTGVWSIIEGTGTVDVVSDFNTIAHNLRGFNRLRWTITDYPENCQYSGETVFQSLLPNTIAKTADDKAVCDNFTQITASEPDYAQGETGLWTIISGGSSTSIANPTDFQTMVTSLGSGINVFKWTISNSSCADTDNITITNNQVFADAGNDQNNVCDSSATISANLLTGTGYWTTTSPTATITNSLATTTLVEHLSFGANNFQWVVSNNGCTDVDEVIVTSILPRNVSAGSDQSICTDNTNLAASNPGIGTGLWQNTGGAGTVADVTANQTTVSGLANNENRFTWTVTVNGCSETDEMSIFNNSIYVNAGTDQTICNQNDLTLNGTQPGTGVTGLWSVRGGSGTFDVPSVYNTVVRNIAKGINTYRWTLSDGNCTNYAELTVTNNTPDSAIVGSDQFICTDNTVINSIPVSNGTGVWNVSSGAGTIVNKSANNTNVTGINTGPNTFTWTVTKNGCSLSADITVTNNSVDAYIADNEVIICTDTHTATIIGNAPGTGETGYWAKQNSADAGIIVNSNSNVTNVTNLANGDTYFTWTIENGNCSNSDVVKVTDNYYNTTANPAGPNTLCVDYSPILGGTPPAGGTGKWSSTAPDVTFDDDTKVSTIVRNLPGGTSAITWTVTKDGCSAPASFNLINNAIYTSAGADQIVCTDYTTMNAQALLSGETGQWTVNNSSVIITDTSDPSTAVSNLIPGANTFTWTIQGNGCSATDEIIVSANAFSVTAGSDDIACGTSYNLAASDPLTGSGVWTVTSGTGRFANASNFETTVYDLENGANTFTWTVNRNGCEASDNVIITNNLYTAVAGDDKSICSDQTTVSAQPLNPVWGASGMWTAQTGGGVFADPTNESTLVTGLAIGNNRLRWTVTKTESGTTCTSYDEMIVTNNSVTASAGTNETTCDDFTTLSATPLDPGASGIWSGGGVTTTIVTPTSATTLVTGLQQGTNTFSWTVNDKGCIGTSSVQIISNHFVANAGGDQIVTVNTATMGALLPDVTATGTWSTISGSGTFTNVNDPNDVVTALGYGVNTFRWEVTWNSCTNYDDVNITYNSITADAGSNQTICSSSTSMNAGDPFPGTGTWSVISGSATIADVNNPNTLISDIQPGSLNILRWTVEIGGYSEYDDVSILNGEFNISAGIDKEECTNETVMTAETAGSGTGSWSVLAGSGNFDDNSLNISRVTNLDEGINLFVWSVTKPSGCSNSDTVQIIYNLPPSAAFEMDQTDGCSPIDVTFTNTTTGGSIYYWYFKNDFRVDSSLTSFTRTYEASYNADSTYTIQLIAESSKGCTDTIEHTVTVYRIPQVDFSATPSAQLYPRTEVFVENLSGSGYSNYYWDMGDGNTYLHNTLVENFSHSYATWGEYVITLSVSSNNCSDTATETVIIYPPQPESTIKPGVRAQGCEDLSVNFESYVNYADTFYWDFGDGGSSNEQDPTYIYDTPGTFIVTLYAGGPGTNDSLITVRRDTVVVFEVPIADFEAIPDTVMLPDQPIICHNNSINGDRYQWTFGGVGDAISTEKSPVHYYTEPGIYTITLEVWTDNDCYDTKTIENAVVVEPAGTFVFPTAFNPYSSYEPNKVFKPKYRGIKEYKLEIYNRWGEKVFESTDPEIGWDGYIDGKVGAQDVYAWKVTGKYKNGAPFQGTGDVTLLR